MDVWAAGQGAGAIRAAEPVADVVARNEQGFVKAQTRLARRRPA
jgi:hypothetical protein